MRAAISENAKNNSEIIPTIQHDQVPSVKHEIESVSMHNVNDKPPAKHSFFGKCQYKTGKCFNERTLKRNGEAHSLCEEHRIKQNLIQRRSDRKYQTVHAVRRRERSQRRAVLKKQVSMAVAQQLFFEHQQQKTLGIPLPQHHPLHLLAVNANRDATAIPMSISSPMQAPLSFSELHAQGNSTDRAIASHCSAITSLQGCLATGKTMSPPKANISSSTCSFLGITVPSSHSLTALKDQNLVRSKMSDNLEYMATVPCPGDKKTWSDDDIEFLHTVLLT